MNKPGLVSSPVSLEERLTLIKQFNDKAQRNQLIEDFIPFIIKTVSDQLNKYIEIENNDEFSVGLIAFDEAIDKYIPGKGHFLKFAELVIRNRVKDSLRKDRFRDKEVPIDQDAEGNIFFRVEQNCSQEESLILRDEIKRYENELQLFSISFEDLVEETPKHEDTRQNAIHLAEEISSDQPLVDELYRKKKLPVNKIVLKYRTTKKILKRSRKYIISLVIVFTGNFDQIRSWVRNSVKGEVNEKR